MCKNNFTNPFFAKKPEEKKPPSKAKALEEGVSSSNIDIGNTIFVNHSGETNYHCLDVSQAMVMVPPFKEVSTSYLI